MQCGVVQRFCLTWHAAAFIRRTCLLLWNKTHAPTS